LINPNASDLLPQRRWAPERFAQLIQAAALEWPEAVFLVTGSPEEKQYAQHVIDMASTPNAYNFAGMVKFGELPALYHVSHVMVTNDSGPGHFSSVTPLPTIVLLQFSFAGYGGDFLFLYFFNVLLCWFIAFLPETLLIFSVIFLRCVLFSPKGFVLVFNAYFRLRIQLFLQPSLQVPFPICDNIFIAPL